MTQRLAAKVDWKNVERIQVQYDSTFGCGSGLEEC